MEKNRFKKVVNSDSTDKVAEMVDIIDGQWNTMKMIQDRSTILSAQVRSTIGTDNINSLRNTLNSDTLTDIYNLQLPSYMAWDYWIAINQWVTYWVNRNEIEADDDIKASFKMALYIMRLYGTIVVTKKDDNYLLGTPVNPEITNGEITGGQMLPSYYANRYGYLSMNPQDKTIELKESSKDKGKLVNIDKENSIFGTCRNNGIGDFVWCMKDILLDVFIKYIITSNTSNLNDKMFMTVNNPKTAPLELWLARNPFIPYAVKIVDSQSGNGTNEFKFSEHSGSEKGHLNTLMDVLRHHQEYYYSKYGRPISSNKSQALSSDSSLSISSAEAIATDWDDRVEAFANEWNDKFGTNIKIVKPELDTPPQNQNADKGGLGIANTEGDMMEQQAKEGK